MRKPWILLLIAALALPVAASGQGCMGGGSEEGVNVIGFIQPQFEYHPNYDDSDLSELTFTFLRARLGVTGTVPYDISYYFVMEFGPFMSGEPPYMLDAFITYTRLPYANITLGQYKQPFSMERNIACHKLHTVRRANFVEALAMDRDIGLMAFGEVAEGLNYHLALMNGTGKNTEDDNKGKDIIGRVTYEPMAYVTLGAGFVSGNSATDVEGADDNTKTRYGADIEVRYRDFLAQGEYIYGKDVGAYTEGGGCGGDPVVKEGSIKRDGYFILLLYRTEYNLEPVVKYERYNADKDDAEDVWHAWTFGFNYFMNDWTRIQANYIRRIEDFVPALNNDEFVVQVQVVMQ